MKKVDFKIKYLLFPHPNSMQNILLNLNKNLKTLMGPIKRLNMKAIIIILSVLYKLL